MDERYFTIDTKDLNFIGSAPHEPTLTIDLSDKEFIESYFGGYESIILTRNGGEHTFTPDEFISGMNRMAHTATRISVPREGHTAIGHYECSDCRGVVGAQDAYCKHCGVRLVDE